MDNWWFSVRQKLTILTFYTQTRLLLELEAAAILFGSVCLGFVSIDIFFTNVNIVTKFSWKCHEYKELCTLGWFLDTISALNSRKSTKMCLEICVRTGIQIDSANVLTGRHMLFRPFHAIYNRKQFVSGLSRNITNTWSVNILPLVSVFLHLIQPKWYRIILWFLWTNVRDFVLIWCV